MPSQAIRAFAYDADRNELTITFTGGRVYVYALVPPAVAKAFADCGSKGAYHNVHIRDRFPFRKLKAPETTAPETLRRALVESTAEPAADIAPLPRTREGQNV